jgi:peptidoglycan/xylan/chitin deacetylase (PgdA/CDA1 family)
VQSPSPAAVDCSRLACVALTFDDGPSAYTEGLIDHLTSLNVRATFFVVGSQVANRPPTALRLQRNGFAVENYTYSHPQLDQLSLSGQRSEVQRCDDALAAAGVASSTLLRPPYGCGTATRDSRGSP